MILQTGFRTDIPGFYSTWFANRLRAGFVLVRNPYNPQSVTRYAINPDVVDLIGFLHQKSCTDVPPHGAAAPLWAVLVCHDHPLRAGDRAACTAEGAGLAGLYHPVKKLSVPIVSHGGMTPFFFPTPTQLRDISLNSSRWHLYFPAIPGPV